MAKKKKLRTKTFRVANVSTNVRAGLRGHVLISQDGETWEVGADIVNARNLGDTVAVPISGASRNFALLGFAGAHRKPNAPEDVIKFVWGQNDL